MPVAECAIVCFHDKKTANPTSDANWYNLFVDFVHLKGLRKRSADAYLRWVRQLDAHYSDAHTPDLTSHQVLHFLLHVQNERKLSGSTVNQAVCALRTLFADHLDKRWKIWSKIKIVRNETLPHVLTREEVDHLLNSFSDGRYRAFFTTMYQTGLRLTEALRLQPKDIDGNRLTLRVVEGKGGKSREVPISAELVVRLRKFWAYHRNPNWLFPAVGRGWKSSGISIADAMHGSKQHMSPASIWAAFRMAVVASGLDKKHSKIGTHTLRHSYATHLLDGGVNVRQVSAYLGHTTLKPTMVYLHLTEISEDQARQALNTLAGQKKH